MTQNTRGFFKAFITFSEAWQGATGKIFDRSVLKPCQTSKMQRFAKIVDD